MTLPAHRERTAPMWDPLREIVDLRDRMNRQFGYRVTLPQDTDAENVSAELAEGVLTIRVPKAQKAKPRRIEIRGGRGRTACADRHGGQEGSDHRGPSPGREQGCGRTAVVA